MSVCASPGEIPAGFQVADCAVSGGTLSGGLGLMLERAGGKLCIRLRPVFMELPLPCPSGVGQILTQSELQARYSGQACHRSDALCTNYFTLLRDGSAFIVLFDSEETLRMKRETAERAGVPLALVEDPALRNRLQT